ncbi:hypothetical protein GCM10028786_16790 [Flaviaesturariibacter terrae]
MALTVAGGRCPGPGGGYDAPGAQMAGRAAGALCLAEGFPDDPPLAGVEPAAAGYRMIARRIRAGAYIDGRIRRGMKEAKKD